MPRDRAIGAPGKCWPAPQWCDALPLLPCYPWPSLFDSVDTDRFFGAAAPPRLAQRGLSAVRPQFLGLAVEKVVESVVPKTGDLEPKIRTIAEMVPWSVENSRDVIVVDMTDHQDVDRQRIVLEPRASDLG